MRLGIAATHPVQYVVPWFRYLAKRIDIEVCYAHRQDAQGQARAGFGVEFDWDIPLLEGYPFRWLTNRSRCPEKNCFGRFDTPEIDEVVRRGRFDAFLVFGWHRKSLIQTVLACRRSRVPVLMRGDSQRSAERPGILGILKYVPYRFFLPRLEAQLYAGQRNRTYLKHYGVSDKRLFFAPHFVDNAFFEEKSVEAETTGRCQEIRKRHGIPQDSFVFLFVGKLIPKKRVGDFIQACHGVLSQSAGRGVHALLVGDGSLRPHLENLAGHHKPGRIHFAGFINQSELPGYYKASSALVLPSDGRETWGLVVNEAFACGLPAIVSEAAGCAPDLIDNGLTGYSYPAGDIQALQRCMLSLKEICQKEPALLRNAIQRKTACYSMERATEGLESALKAVVERIE